MKSVALVLVMSLGCTTYAGSKRTANAGGYTMLAGVAIAAIGGGIVATQGDSDLGTVWTAISVGLAGAVVFGSGAVVRVVGLNGMSTHAPRDTAVANEVREACLQKREEQLAAARKIADPGKRTRALLAIAPCDR